MICQSAVDCYVKMNNSILLILKQQDEKQPYHIMMYGNLKSLCIRNDPTNINDVLRRWLWSIFSLCLSTEPDQCVCWAHI